MVMLPVHSVFRALPHLLPDGVMISVEVPVILSVLAAVISQVWSRAKDTVLIIEFPVPMAVKVPAAEIVGALLIVNVGKMESLNDPVRRTITGVALDAAVDSTSNLYGACPEPTPTKLQIVGGPNVPCGVVSTQFATTVLPPNGKFESNFGAERITVDPDGPVLSA